jgi:hypothetical protein
MTSEALLLRYGITLPSYAPGRYYSTCPKCSRDRSAANRDAKCLGVTIEANDAVHWGCNHCGWTGPAGGSGNSHNGPPVTAYIYRDKGGVPRFRKVRNPPGREPRFWLQKWDGAGGWQNGTKGVDTSLIYRANEVDNAIAAGQKIALVEGEKDADRLWSLGIAASCNAHGASEMGKKPKWTAAHSAQLLGASIIVFNDNDSAGYAHAKTTCQLSVDVAKSIQRLDLALHWPAIGSGDDVSDWLDRGGGTRDRLLALIDAAPNYSEGPPQPPVERLSVSLDDFWAYMPQHNYLFAPVGELWPGASVNSRIPPISVGMDEKGEPITIPASAWLDRNKPVEQMTWAPGEPKVIRDRLVSGGGWIEHPGVGVFNLYRAPTLALGDPSKAGPWLDHVRRVYPNDAEHIIKWLAHRVQRPQEKINHALVLGGPQGIGKDTLVEPVTRAVGPWNVAEVTPQQLLGRFNGFLKSAILRVSEARDLGEVNRFSFYDHLKAMIAAPPDVLRIDEKNLREYNIPNLCGVIITTNHKTDGIFLPADDRRHYVAWSEMTKDDFEAEYWTKLWRWYEDGGFGHVAAYLASYDLAGFDPKAPPPKTKAFWDIVDASRAPEDAELADVIDKLGEGTEVSDLLPLAFTLTAVQAKANALAPKDNDGNPERSSFAYWLADRKNRRAIPHRLENVGYAPIRNDDAKDGLWKVAGTRQVIYALANRSLHDRLAAATHVINGKGKTVFDLDLFGGR